MATVEPEKSYWESIEERIELLRQEGNRGPEGVENLLEFVRSYFAYARANGVGDGYILYTIDECFEKMGIKKTS